MLQGVLARGTARSMAGIAPFVAGKTGTSDEENDAWFVGFSNDVTVAVWVGYDNADGKRRTLGGGATGGHTAVPIFEPVMQAVWAHVAPRTALAPPSPEAKRQLSCKPIGGEARDGKRRATLIASACGWMPEARCSTPSIAWCRAKAPMRRRGKRPKRARHGNRARSAPRARSIGRRRRPTRRAGVGRRAGGRSTTDGNSITVPGTAGIDEPKEYGAMANLYEILENAEHGQAMALVSREFELTPEETEAAVTALLPAISTGLKRSTATPEGLGNLFGMMGYQPHLRAMYDDPETAFGRQGIAAGNDVLSVMFGSPDVSRAISDQAQQFSGVDLSILKKLLPVLAGILISGLMRGGSGQAAPSAPPSSPAQGGGLGDILGQIFGRETAAPAGPPRTGQQAPMPPSQPIPVPTEDGGQSVPGGDLLGHILREFEKGIREGRIKPVIIGGGPFEIPMPGGPSGPAPAGPGQKQVPGGDIFGQILRDLLGGGAGGPVQAPGRQGPSPGMKELSDLSKGQSAMGGVGAAVFGDWFEAGREVEQRQLDNIQRVFDRAAEQPKRG